MNQSTHRLFALMILLLAAAPGASAQQALEVQSLADFESGLPVDLETIGGKASIESDRPARGQQCLRITIDKADSGPTNLHFKLPRNVDLTRFSDLSVQIRASTDEPTIKGRWLAIDANGKTLFRRPFSIDATDEWHALQEPLARWIWSGDRTGPWNEVVALTLSIEVSGSDVFLDDLQLKLAPTTRPASEAIVALAFPRDRSVWEQDGLVIATDVDGIRPEDLNPLAENMRRARAMIQRVFGDAVRPIGRPQYAYLFIFRDDARRNEFFARLGRYWRATIAPPRAQGYTVQSIATATWDPKQGIRRPVFLHESTHAVAAYDLRLLTGNPPHTWLHEGLASYVQVCVYPKSLESGFYESAFARPLGKDQGGRFEPLATLLSRRAESRDYAQLASIIAYLVENQPALLAALARGLADGQTVEQVLSESGTSLRQLEADWMHWGKQAFAPGSEQRDRHFDLPLEFRDR